MTWAVGSACRSVTRIDMPQNRCGWRISASLIGGLLPPGAVSAEAVDERGTRVAAAVGDGAYVAVLEQPNDGHEPIVCCRDTAGRPVRRPWAADYPSVRVTDAEEPCPACGAIDYDEYTPFEDWRGGTGSKVDGTNVPSPIVSCRVCGHEEREGGFITMRSESSEGEDEATRTARIARFRAERRNREWLTAAPILRTAPFSIYGALDWPARLGGHGSQDGQLTEVTVSHYENPDADPLTGDRPRVAITTRRNEYPVGVLERARATLENWIGKGAAPAPWPDASRAAVTLWLRARRRERRAVALNAIQSEQLITIDDMPIPALMLNGPQSRWVAAVRHAGLTILIAAHDLAPASLCLQPISDPAERLLGPEPPDA